MRLICTINTVETDENPLEFSHFLSSQGVDNECEEVSGNAYRIWVYEEDQVEQALSLYKSYTTNPHDTRYRIQHDTAVRIQRESQSDEKEEETQLRARPVRRRFLSPAPYGPISILVLAICIALFIWAQFERGPIIPPKIPGIIQAPILAPIERDLLYDYPPYFQKRDKLFTLYTPKDIKEKKPPSAEARKLIQELRHSTKPWMGVYDRIVKSIQNSAYSFAFHGSMFVKISQGEIWRLLTPAFLHYDLLHIFFNLLWFILLGNQIEFRLGWWRYIALIIISAICSNTTQYLMSGPFFLGLSGVVVGMAGFIWARQQVAPWEGYLLHRFTLIFLTVFVLGMFVLQLVFFFLQITSHFELSIGIANTAHLTGGLVGYLLGRLRIFSIRQHKKIKHKN